MSTKKFAQLFLLLMLVTASFMTTTTARAANTCGTGYTIASGDTLRRIAAQCGTTISALRLANPEIGAGNLIYPGQGLLLPGAILTGDGFNTYIVASGDTLKAIAARFGTSLNNLLSLNPEITNANVIYEGQRLVYPANGGNPNPGPLPGGHTYTVQRGDTLKKIAAWAGTTTELLLQVNPQVSNANLIYVGQRLNLPGTVASYTIQRGDTLKKIAAKFGTTIENLAALNGLADPNRIYVGQPLRLW
jgi:LysM repeat protein